MDGNILAFDKHGMGDVIKAFPDHVREACKIGEKIELKNTYSDLNRVLILGMGGSAIGGDLIRNYFKYMPGAEKLLINVNRDYNYVDSLDENSLVIVSSYSGNTEETLSAFDKARMRNSKILVISSGGKLSEKAKENGFDLITIPSGYQPRAALAFSFFPLLYFFMLSGILGNDLIKDIATSINELITKLDADLKIFSKQDESNPAFKLALGSERSMPVIYSSNLFEVVNLRWRGQIQENSKRIAFGNIVPEMNHNEINAWENVESYHQAFKFIIIKDESDHIRVNKRLDFLYNLLKEQKRNISLIETEGKSLLTKMFHLINLGDWYSYWLALINATDPTEINTILKLKDHMGD